MTSTLISIFETQARGNARPALRSKRAGSWETVSFQEWRARSRRLASFLMSAGIAPHDRVAIFATTRREWVIADAAVLYCGAVTVPVYASLIGDQAAYIVGHAEAKILVAEDAAYVKRIFDASAATIANLSRILLIDGDGSSLPQKIAEKCVKWSDACTLRENSPDDEAKIDERVAQTKPDDLATLMYTSGTTGPPKGAMLTHDNFVFETSSLLRALDVSHDDEALLFLPMAHIFAKILVAMQMRVGYAISFAESVPKTMDNALEVNPTFFPSVPRLYEKIHAVANDKAAQAGGVKKKIFDWAFSIGKKAARAKVEGRPMGVFFALEHALAKKLVLGKVRGRFGNRIRFAITGGAPLAEELCVWFHAAGVEVLEGYGLTETTAGSTITTIGALKFGTVGKAVEGLEVKLAPDGEVLMRGRSVMKGYFKKPEDTKEAIDEQGYFHSGDIGTIDADGFLKITDRKKDLIVTAGGKNVAPQNIENLLKQAPLVSQAVVLGDRKPYLVALITLDAEAASRVAKEDVEKLVQADVDAVNAKLSKYETVKKFAILPNDFSIDSGELTPTLKVKRKVVAEKYASIVEGLYA
ncbi:MAG: AMP-dependent synthetase/ligase [Polyangiaceae bacterium]